MRDGMMLRDKIIAGGTEADAAAMNAAAMLREAPPGAGPRTEFDRMMNEDRGYNPPGDNAGKGDE